MALFNLESGTTFITPMLVGDNVQTPRGSVDSTPQFTMVNGEIASIALEIQSILGALLLPRVTTTVMNSLVATNGMVVFNITAQSLYAYQSNAWAQLASIGPDIGLSQGANIVLTPNPIVGSGTIALSTTLTGLISAQIGNMTLSSSNINSTGSLIFGTNGSTPALTLSTSQNAAFNGNITVGNFTISGSTIASAASLIFETSGTTPALTIDTSQNAIFDGNVSLDNSNVIILGSNATGISTFTPSISIFSSTSDAISIGMVSGGTQAQIQSIGVALNITGALGIFLQSAVTCSSTLALHSGVGGGSITLQAPNTATNPTYTLPIAPVSNGQALTSTTAGVMSWTTLTTGTVTSITQGTNMSFSVTPITSTGTINLASTLTGLTSVGVGSLTLSGTSINSSGQLTLGTNGSTTALTLSTSQTATFVSSVRINTNAGLLLNNSANTFATTVLAGAISSNFNFTLPATLPTISNNQALTANTSGTSQWTTVAVNGGNTLGATLTIGTTDANPLNLNSNGSTVLSLDAGIHATFAGGITINGNTAISQNTGAPGNSYNIGFSNGTTSSFIGYNGSDFVFLSAGRVVLESNNIAALTLDTSQTAIFANNVQINGTTITGAGPSLNIGNSGIFRIGTGNTVSGVAPCFTIGVNNSVSTQYSASFGVGNTITTTTGGYAFGSNHTVSGGNNAMAFGNMVNISGSGSFAFGNGSPNAFNITGSNVFAFCDGSNAKGISTNNAVYFSTTGYFITETGPTFNKTTFIPPNTCGFQTSGGAAIFGPSDSNSLTLQTNAISGLTIDSSQNGKFNGGQLTLGTSSSHTGSLIFDCSGNTNTLTHTVPSSITTSYSLTWPAAAPAVTGYVLSSTTGGALSWVASAPLGRLFVQSSGTQSISSLTNTAVNFATTNYNTGSVFTIASNNKFTNTSGNTIYVLIIYNVYWASTAAAGTALGAWIVYNSSTTNYALSLDSVESASIDNVNNGSIVLQLNNNDFIQIIVNQSTAGSLNIGGSGSPFLNTLNIWQIG